MTLIQGALRPTSSAKSWNVTVARRRPKDLSSGEPPREAWLVGASWKNIKSFEPKVAQNRAHAASYQLCQELECDRGASKTDIKSFEPTVAQNRSARSEQEERGSKVLLRKRGAKARKP